jgi:hypothetical protein
MFKPLSNSLQVSIRFFFHPLPSRDFGLCCLGLTKSIRPLLDSLRLTLLYRLVFCSLLGVIYSAVGLLFTRMLKPVLKILPTYLLVGAYQPYLAHW